MPTAVLISQSAADFLCCLGLGLALAALYDCGRFLFGSTKAVVLGLDIAFFIIAGILVCSYAAARSYAGIVRWYHLLGIFAGEWAYYTAFYAITQKMRKILLNVLFQPFAWVWKNVFCKIFCKFVKCWKKKWKKQSRKQKKNKTNPTKQLQNATQMLYNSK